MKINSIAKREKYKPPATSGLAGKETDTSHTKTAA